MLTSSGGVIHRRAVAKIESFIEAEVRAGAYDPPVDPSTLAYAMYFPRRFSFNDATAAMRGDVERLRESAALLGVRST
jgi:hypothetical protein